MVTKKELSFYSMDSDMLCLLCQEPDSISHTFLNCHWSKHFFPEVIKWGNIENGTAFSPSPLEILIGLEQKDYSQAANNSIIKFNCTLLFAKYSSIYTKKLLKKEIHMKEIIQSSLLNFKSKSHLKVVTMLLFSPPPNSVPQKIYTGGVRVMR